MAHESDGARLRVALIAPAAEQREALHAHLCANGLEPVDVTDGAAGEPIGRGVADVLLVNLDDEGEAAADLDGLIERAEVPVLFNDAEAMRRQAPASLAARAWGRRLAEKLHQLARSEAPDAGSQPPGAVGGGTVPPPQQARSQWQPALAPGAAAEVWVLAASIGGPQALSQFLQVLPGGLPVGLVIAQHIGAGFAELLADQLSRASALEVRCGSHGAVLGPGEVVVAPVEQRFGFSQPGRIALEPDRRQSIYSPCIDDVMFAAAEAYGARAGAVIFSGMGSDGVAGACAIAAAGGAVFAQEPEGCVVSSMADAAREAGIVSASGTPAALAHAFLQRIGGGRNESVGA